MSGDNEVLANSVVARACKRQRRCSRAYATHRRACDPKIHALRLERGPGSLALSPFGRVDVEILRACRSTKAADSSPLTEYSSNSERFACARSVTFQLERVLRDRWMDTTLRTKSSELRRNRHVELGDPTARCLPVEENSACVCGRSIL